MNTIGSAIIFCDSLANNISNSPDGVHMSKILYIDMDDVICDYSASYNQSLINRPEFKFPQSEPNFFRDLRPIDNAIDTVNSIRNMDTYKVFILTAPSTRNPHSYTEKRLWIENHFDYDFTKRLIISPDKSLLKGDLLIDDYIHGKGQESFEGELIHFGSEIFPDWVSIAKYLL